MRMFCDEIYNFVFFQIIFATFFIRILVWIALHFLVNDNLKTVFKTKCNIKSSANFSSSKGINFWCFLRPCVILPMILAEVRRNRDQKWRLYNINWYCFFNININSKKSISISTSKNNTININLENNTININLEKNTININLEKKGKNQYRPRKKPRSIWTSKNSIQYQYQYQPWKKNSIQY